MPSNDLLAQRMLARIAQSAHQLEVHYPPARVAPTGAAPAPAPMTLLNKPAVTHAVVEPDATPVKPPVTMTCLWMDAVVWTDRKASVMTSYGWVAEADAMARVSASDAGNGAVFLGTDHVTHDGREFKVLSVVPMGASFAAPSTYAVWLKGAWKN